MRADAAGSRLASTRSLGHGRPSATPNSRIWTAAY